MAGVYLLRERRIHLISHKSPLDHFETSVGEVRIALRYMCLVIRGQSLFRAKDTIPIRFQGASPLSKGDRGNKNDYFLSDASLGLSLFLHLRDRFLFVTARGERGSDRNYDGGWIAWFLVPLFAFLHRFLELKKPFFWHFLTGVGRCYLLYGFFEVPGLEKERFLIPLLVILDLL